MSSFKIWMKLVHNNPEAEAQGSFAQSANKLQDRESLFYAGYAKHFWASASGLL